MDEDQFARQQALNRVGQLENENGANRETSGDALPSANGVDGGEHLGKPSANGVNGVARSDGRDNRGRFAPGNKGGPGNPFARRVAKLRQLMIDTVREEGLEAIVQHLVEAAKSGNIAAAKLVLAYVIGKPSDVLDPDRIDVEGWKLLHEMGIEPDNVTDLLNMTPADLACQIMQVHWPSLHSMAEAPRETTPARADNPPHAAGLSPHD